VTRSSGTASGSKNSTGTITAQPAALEVIDTNGMAIRRLLLGLRGLQ
jgi:hypothetical protein